MFVLKHHYVPHQYVQLKVEKQKSLRNNQPATWFLSDPLCAIEERGSYCHIGNWEPLQMRSASVYLIFEIPLGNKEPLVSSLVEHKYSHTLFVLRSQCIALLNTSCSPALQFSSFMPLSMGQTTVYCPESSVHSFLRTLFFQANGQ